MIKLANLLELTDFFLAASAAKSVYGPYTSSVSGRQHMILRDEDGKTRTIQYPRWLMEQRLGRPLEPDETVQHRDGDFNNNDDSNLELLPRSQHSATDAKRVKLIELTCPMCDKHFQRSPRLVRDKSKKGKVSSFCSRECAGKYSREVQLGLRDRLPVPEPPQSEYYCHREALIDVANDLIAKYGM
jgi:HNH endonuclease